MIKWGHNSLHQSQFENGTTRYKAQRQREPPSFMRMAVYKGPRRRIRRKLMIAIAQERHGEGKARGSE